MTVVVGFAQRPEAWAAFGRAIEESKLRSVPLHVVYVAPSAPASHEAQARRWNDDVDVAARVQAELQDRIAEAGAEAQVHIFTDGQRDPATRLLQVAHDFDAELIVIGLRERSRLGKLVVGSVAQDVLLHADAPVLAVRPPN